jgi:hypothetical protein
MIAHVVSGNRGSGSYKGVMRTSHDSELPDDLAEVAESLRRYGPQTTPLQLDAIKCRALTRASHAGLRKGPMMKRKLVTLTLVTGFALSSGVAGVMAATSGSGSAPSAAKVQYCNNKDNNRPKGCTPR